MKLDPAMHKRWCCERSWLTNSTACHREKMHRVIHWCTSTIHFRGTHRIRYCFCCKAFDLSVISIMSTRVQWNRIKCFSRLWWPVQSTKVERPWGWKTIFNRLSTFALPSISLLRFLQNSSKFFALLVLVASHFATLFFCWSVGLCSVIRRSSRRC